MLALQVPLTYLLLSYFMYYKQLCPVFKITLANSPGLLFLKARSSYYIYSVLLELRNDANCNREVTFNLKKH